MPCGRLISGLYDFGEFLRSQKFLKFFIGKFILIYLSESPISSQPNLLPLAVQRG